MEKRHGDLETSMRPSAVTILWDAAGRPDPNWQGRARQERAAPPSRHGVCALTGRTGQVWDARHVISDNFTSWDRLPFARVDPDGVAFCAAAAWAFRHRPLMLRPHSTINGALTEVDPPALYDALRQLPHNPHAMILIPISRQKHVAPWAVTGCVGTDDEWLPWHQTDVERLATYRALRRFGFTEPALSEPAPRWHIVSKLETGVRQWALLHWSDLDPWRHHPAYLEVAGRATRTTKDTAT